MPTPPAVQVSADAWSDLDLLEEQVTAQWPAGLRAFIQDGAGKNRAVAANRSAHRRWALRSRVLVDVGEIDTRTTVLGHELRQPVMVAPSGLHTLLHADGEVATAAGAAAAGSLMVLSSGTGRTIADVRQVDVPTWFQLYWNADRERVRSLIGQATGAGCTAVCLTADMPARPLLGAAMRAGVASVADARPQYVLPRGAHLSGGVWDHDARLTWRDIAWLRSVCPVPIAVKGIMTGEDALLAYESGVDAIVVSNHGGRALDTPCGTLDVLPEVIAALRGAGAGMPVLVDGGFRHGADVLAALALGADAVLLGRPILWGLSAAGVTGVRDVLTLVRDQLAACMAMVGAPCITAIGRGCVRRAAGETHHLEGSYSREGARTWR